MGWGDSIKGAILDVVPGDAARKLSSAMDGHTTSGLDRAMQSHADQEHPVGSNPRIIPRSQLKPDEVVK